MLKKIKSIHISKIVFSYIEEKQKLKVVKFNKKIQEILTITLINYKLLSGKYIINEPNGLAKEYNSFTDDLIFEGDYLNGKRHGKGKEYFQNKLIYEGDYANGKKNGKIKRYNDGKIVFDGVYLNDQKLVGIYYDKKGAKIHEINNIYGKGREYDDNGNLKFEGEYLNGEKNGKGNEYHDGILSFEGNFLNGKKIGRGKEYYSNRNLKFVGEYFYDIKWEGKGYDIMNNLIYELKEGKGFIKEYDFNGVLEFEGNYLGGRRNGNGKEFDKDGNLKFEGEYVKGLRSGYGKEYNKEDLIFDGQYFYNQRRNGVEFIKEKLEFEGEYLYNKKWNGKGYDEYGNVIYELINGNGVTKEYHDNYNLKFVGELINGKKNGIGKEYDLNGKLIFEGEYLNGLRNGIGKEYGSNGKPIFKGEYLNGKKKMKKKKN